MEAAILARGNVYAMCSGIAIATSCAWTVASADSVEAEREMPDIAFLEYLGMWEESDEDWQLMNDDTLQAKNDDRTDPDVKDERATENQDEH